MGSTPSTGFEVDRPDLINKLLARRDYAAARRLFDEQARLAGDRRMPTGETRFLEALISLGENNFRYAEFVLGPVSPFGAYKLSTAEDARFDRHLMRCYIRIGWLMPARTILENLKLSSESDAGWLHMSATEIVLMEVIKSSHSMTRHTKEKLLEMVQHELIKVTQIWEWESTDWSHWAPHLFWLKFLAHLYMPGGAKSPKTKEAIARLEQLDPALGKKARARRIRRRWFAV